MIYIIFNFIGLGMFLVAGLLAGLFLALGCKINEEWYYPMGSSLVWWPLASS